LTGVTPALALLAIVARARSKVASLVNQRWPGGRTAFAVDIACCRAELFIVFILSFLECSQCCIGLCFCLSVFSLSFYNYGKPWLQRISESPMSDRCSPLNSHSVEERAGAKGGRVVVTRRAWLPNDVAGQQ
jgi:hypothetical protein